MNPPTGLTATGMIALAGDCWDQFGNKLLPGSVLLRIINGSIATLAITQTNIADAAGALTGAGVAPGVTPITVVAPAIASKAVLMAGVAPTVSVS